jgi:hypothetical protein
MPVRFTAGNLKLAERASFFTPPAKDGDLGFVRRPEWNFPE